MGGVTIEPVASNDIQQIYKVNFHGNRILTTVTNDASAVSKWIRNRETFHRQRLDRLIVGVDVEWRPSFSRHQNPIATLQLCIGTRCLIYQLAHTDKIPTELVNFLSNDNYTFVGDRVNSHLEKLDKDYKTGNRTNTVDLAKLAAIEYDRKEIKGWRLKALSRFVLDRDMEKPRSVEVSGWDERYLTDEQVKFASVDAFVSFEIGRFLNASDYRLAEPKPEIARIGILEVVPSLDETKSEIEQIGDFEVVPNLNEPESEISRIGILEVVPSLNESESDIARIGIMEIMPSLNESESEIIPSDLGIVPSSNEYESEIVARIGYLGIVSSMNDSEYESESESDSGVSTCLGIESSLDIHETEPELEHEAECVYESDCEVSYCPRIEQSDTEVCYWSGIRSIEHEPEIELEHEPEYVYEPDREVSYNHPRIEQSDSEVCYWSGIGSIKHEPEIELEHEPEYVHAPEYVYAPDREGSYNYPRIEQSDSEVCYWSRNMSIEHEPGPEYGYDYGGSYCSRFEESDSEVCYW